MKLFIAIPSYREWIDAMGLSLIKAIQALPYPVTVEGRRGYQVDRNREELMLQAAREGYDKIVFIDTDMLFLPKSLTQLIGHSKTIIGGAYNEKILPKRSTVKLDDGKGAFLDGDVTLPSKPFMCGAIGTGFMAVYLPVFVEKVPQPWFEYDHVTRELMGEDVFFCKKARAHGLEIWCDPTIPLQHLGDYAY